MFYRIFCALFLIILSFSTNAQKRNNVWAFGIKSGLDFNTSPVSLFPSAIQDYFPPYTVSSICDKDGKLLFYTDGIKVWNAYNDLMPKYRNWWPWSNKVLPLICPYPGNDSLYYLFGIDNGVNSYNLMYLTIKMYKSGDFEEVVYPRPVDASSFYTKLSAGCSMVLTGTAHCNTKDVWIITHTAQGFLSYLITKSGISSTPVISTISPDIIPTKLLDTKKSNIKFSANGERMIVPLFEESKIAVFDFDNQTGTFQNAIKVSVPAGHRLEDVEISPDASKLYFGAFEIVDPETQAEMHYIYQMDLNAGTVSQIEQSIYKVNVGDRAACSPRGSCVYVNRNMLLGPDGKIYVSMKEYTSTNLDRTMSVIEDPNKKGLDSRYREEYLNLGRQYKYINYNYIRSGSFSLKENGIKTQKISCSDQPVSFGLLFNRIDSVKWDFGDPVSGARNFSQLLTPDHQYPGPGTYTAKAIIYNRCLVDTASKEIVIQEDKSVQVPAVIQDSFFCVGNKLMLDATTAFANAYKWENGLIFPNRVIDQPGQYKLTVYNDCSIAYKSFEVIKKECDCEVFVPNAFTPNNDGLNDVFKPVSKCYTTDYRFSVFDRYGRVIFESNERGKGWNGKTAEREFPTGVYAWFVQYRNPNTHELIHQNGTVTLIR